MRAKGMPEGNERKPKASRREQNASLIEAKGSQREAVGAKWEAKGYQNEARGAKRMLNHVEIMLENDVQAMQVFIEQKKVPKQMRNVISKHVFHNLFEER